MTGIELIAAERERQGRVEGFGEEHDETHESGELSSAAIVYVRTAVTAFAPHSPHAAAPMPEPPADWPWAPEWFKPTWSDPVRALVKAGALIAAEIDRLTEMAVSNGRCGGGIHFHGVGDFCECGAQPNTFGASL